MKKIFATLVCLLPVGCAGGGANDLLSTFKPMPDQVKMVDGDYVPPPKGIQTSRDRAAIFMQAATMETKPYMDQGKTPAAMPVPAEPLPGIHPAVVTVPSPSSTPARAAPVTKVVSSPLVAPVRAHPAPSMPETTRTLPVTVPAAPTANPLPDMASSRGA